MFAERLCGGILNATSGFIVSPDLDRDGKYDALLTCFWLIVAQKDKLIQFQVLYVDIKQTELCGADKLQVRKLVMAMSKNKINKRKRWFHFCLGGGGPVKSTKAYK